MFIDKTYIIYLIKAWLSNHVAKYSLDAANAASGENVHKVTAAGVCSGCGRGTELWLRSGCHSLVCSPSRRTSSPSGTRRPATRPPRAASETPCAGCSTCPPTPSWSTRRTQTASSMYVSPFNYYYLDLDRH